MPDQPTPPPAGSPARALHGITRLLAGADRDDVLVALAREVRTALGSPAALVARLEPGDAALDLVASAPEVQPGRAALSPADHAAMVRSVEAGGLVDLALEAEGGSVFARLGLATDATSGLVGALEPEPDGRPVLLVAGREDSFTADDHAAVAALLAAASSARARHVLTEGQDMQSAHATALARAARAVNETLELPAVLDQVCREAAGLVDADVALVARGDESEGTAITAAWGLPPEVIGHRFEPGGLAGSEVERGAAMRSDEYRALAEGGRESPLARVRAALAVPLRWDGAQRGVLLVGFVGSQRTRPEQLERLESFAQLAAFACRNASEHAGLARAVRTDTLTGCLNHAALQESLRREIDRCRRQGGRLAVVLVDLDDFKRVNAEQGHLVGDEVLRRAGRALRQAVRPYDLVARYGGDEFAIVAVDAGEFEAAEIAARALDWLRSTLSEYAGASEPAAPATAGVAEWGPGRSRTELIAEADRALLFGKHEKRRGEAIPASFVPESFRPGRFRAWAEPVTQAVSAGWWREARHDQSERLRLRTRQLALANALGTRLAAMTNREAIVSVAADELHRAFGYFLCSVVHLGADGWLASVARRGRAPAGGHRGWRQPADTGLIGRCVRERRPVMVNDVSTDPDYMESAATRDTRSELCVPIFVRDGLWGVLNVEEVRLDAFDQDDVRLVETVADQVGSALHSAFLYEQLDRAYLGTAEALATALEAKDDYTASHARSIIETAEEVGRRLGMDEPMLRAVRYGAALHDIGKIAVPEAILNKRGPLTGAERAEIERHTVVGEQILAPVEFLGDVRPLVRHEHERWDGGGYPDGLSGEAIPLGARIILACDAYQAMTSDRPYRQALSTQDARRELQAGAGSQFDPRVVEVLLAVLDDEDRAATRRGVAPDA